MASTVLKEVRTPYMTDAQIAKRTKDHLDTCGMCKDLTEKQVWRIGYIYADVIRDYQGQVDLDSFIDLNFDCLSEAVERFELDREMWLASRP